jgi:hypothetical protein
MYAQPNAYKIHVHFSTHPEHTQYNRGCVGSPKAPDLRVDDNETHPKSSGKTLPLSTGGDVQALKLTAMRCL